MHLISTVLATHLNRIIALLLLSRFLLLFHFPPALWMQCVKLFYDLDRHKDYSHGGYTR